MTGFQEDSAKWTKGDQAMFAPLVAATFSHPLPLCRTYKVCSNAQPAQDSGELDTLKSLTRLRPLP
jgi:hypothetical protein